ncbi:NADPH-dependent FMN reductase [Mycoplasma sp. E35C]|uniref:NADPH-dependent FMN reductase n=1 Tax=Mycoplasma sp. E35C TaxID=2801918 RepID=UPI001CA3EFFE|nr:NAD(P)H-dependent oxidoreductase [Mycoplasma sp. E35C]QZX49358.1 NAD(P)H-dependent oxidoreductase [Mycoplasma sp. E35C]
MNKAIIVSCSNTNFKTSINYDLASKIAHKGSFDLLNLADYNVELFSIDIKANVPAKINELKAKLLAYEKIVFITPEINGYLAAFAKNIFDWLSLEGAWLKDKKAYVATATPGAKGGPMVRSIFSQVLEFFGAKVLGSVGFAEYKLDANKDQEILEFVNNINN